MEHQNDGRIYADTDGFGGDKTVSCHVSTSVCTKGEITAPPTGLSPDRFTACHAVISTGTPTYLSEGGQIGFSVTDSLAPLACPDFSYTA